MVLGQMLIQTATRVQLMELGHRHEDVGEKGASEACEFLSVGYLVGVAMSFDFESQ